jgi:hypothetical protein
MIIVHLKVGHSNSQGTTKTGSNGLGSTVAELDFATEFSRNRSLSSRATTIDGEQRIAFVLRRDPYWLFGNQCQRLSVVFPSAPHILITGIDAVPAQETMPILRIVGGTFESSGLAQKLPAEIQIDATAIPKAASCRLEISKAWKAFNLCDSSDGSEIISRITEQPTKGTILLTPAMFPGSGNYAVRAVALDGSSSPVGIPGDHLVIHVE